MVARVVPQSARRRHAESRKPDLWGWAAREKRALFASLRGWLAWRGQLVLLVLICLGWRRHWLSACLHWLKADLSPFLLGKTGAAQKKSPKF